MQTLTSWLSISETSDFSIYNLPFGIFSTADRTPRVGVAIGEKVLDMAQLANSGALDGLVADRSVFSQSSLNAYISLGKSVTVPVRTQVQQWLCDTDSPIYADQSMLVDMGSVQMHMPVEVGDYTDFYSSIEHATNVGKMFRDPANALLPNWRHLPVGYHGRASSIVVSGTPIRRPKGQTKANDATLPAYGPSKRLDFELEMAFVIGKENGLGQPVSTDEAEEYIFGMVLFNDWSARDIQKWEYVPLGPFLGKNFASSVSPWVVTLEALEPFRVAGPEQDPAVLPYLTYEGTRNYDLDLEVSIQAEGQAAQVVSRSNFRYMYWNMTQQLAHHTVNGCNMKVGDMLASGTISGKDEASYGSMLEIAWAGSKPLPMPDGSTRAFIHDGDTVCMKGFGQKDGVRVGFGEVSGKVLPAHP